MEQINIGGDKPRQEVDMHIHSHYSDGDCSIKELVNRIKLAGLKAAVLTDHDKISGVKQFRKLCAENGIATTTGIEISTDFPLHKNKVLEFHILGYGFNLDQLARYQEYLQHNIDTRCLQIKRMLKLYSDKNELVTNPEAITEIFNLPHNYLSNKYWVARLRARKLVLKSMDTLDFRIALKTAAKEVIENGSFYAPRGSFISPQEAIEVINNCGGKTVLAHPMKGKADALELEMAVKKLREYGLYGLETHREDETDEAKERLMKLCAKYGLNHSFGGSDYHGDKSDEHKPTDYLGKGGIPFTNFSMFMEF